MLRGCIGTFQSGKLQENLHQYALIAAYEDSRFPPIKEKELKHLHCGVSLLVNFKEITDDHFDWQIGKHGIQIFFELDLKPFRATFLPEIAEKRSWDHITTFNNLIQKAGVSKRYEDVKDKITKVLRYESAKAALSYDDYVAIKS